MHIAFNGWFWDQPNTGSGQYLRRLLHALRRVAPDLQMTLVLPPGLTSADDLPADVSLITTTGSRGNLGKVRFEQQTFPQMAGRCGADIAHVPYWGTPLSSPIPLITSILDVIPLVMPEYSPGWRGRLYTSLVSAAGRGSAHVITISDAAKADIVQYLKIPAEKITTTYLAADEQYNPRMGAEHDPDVRAKYNLPDRYVLYLGGFDVRKRVDQLLLAFTYVIEAEGGEVPLVIAGREPQWGSPMFPDLKKYIAELGIGEWVQWLGYVDEADKPAIYRMADVFAFPTVYEGFCLPVLEAMACGTPVVANEIPVLEEVTGDGAFLTTKGDARKMAGAIIALLEQEPLRETQITRGLSQATRYSWRKTARETLAVYEQVLKA
ncbi:MAG: glycosyltransferase family 4 protein [Chloroflexi bacterium]|uniref:glycosyltransferase family 4 protein n=1 Tax=Candidatus Flexifilum breve TaxID=3140694 RepID=UPI003135E6DB|nr:glycosyltransferase family 4 protein [Chloroflexota bacterium]